MPGSCLIAIVCVLGGARFCAAAPYSLQTQLRKDRAHAKALGLRKTVGVGDIPCGDRRNIDSCLGNIYILGRNRECAWCNGKCTGMPSFGKHAKCHELKDKAKAALCKSCRFKLLCSEWAEKQEDGGCDSDQIVVKWDDNKPTDYSAYRQFSGYNCKSMTCDTKDQCCYKTKKEEKKKCSDWPQDNCQKWGKLPKISKQEIYCGKNGCRISDCCDNTCFKPNWGYCRKGTLKADSELKQIRCLTPSKYRGQDPECSDLQCCNLPEPYAQPDMGFSVTEKIVQTNDFSTKSACAAAFAGVAVSALAAMAIRRRAGRGLDTSGPGAFVLTDENQE